MDSENNLPVSRDSSEILPRKAGPPPRLTLAPTPRAQRFTAAVDWCELVLVTDKVTTVVYKFA